MGLFHKKEKSKEELLVSELVGTGTFHSANVRNMDMNVNEKALLHNSVKEIWKNGGSCEEIQAKYDEMINIVSIIEANKELVDSLVGAGVRLKGKVKELDLDWNEKNEVQRVVKNAWFDGSNSAELNTVFNDSVNAMINARHRKEEERKLKEKAKIDAKREEIRSGVNCTLAKDVEGTTSNPALASLMLGLRGYMLTSGNTIERKTIGVPGIIKVVPKGVVISPKNENEMRITFENIIGAEESLRYIKLIKGVYIHFMSCDYGREISSLINESASGSDEEGWN